MSATAIATRLPERLALNHAQRAAAIRARPLTDTDHAHREARPEQHCPDWGRVEVSGPYCTRCLLPMGPEDRREPKRRMGQAKAAASRTRAVVLRGGAEPVSAASTAAREPGAA